MACAARIGGLCLSCVARFNKQLCLQRLRKTREPYLAMRFEYCPTVIGESKGYMFGQSNHDYARRHVADKQQGLGQAKSQQRSETSTTNATKSSKNTTSSYKHSGHEQLWCFNNSGEYVGSCMGDRKHQHRKRL